MDAKEIKTEKANFSKSLMGAIMFLYFIGFGIGTILVAMAAMIDVKLGTTMDSSMFIAYATYIGGPTATAIGFYAWKSKAENVIKIAKSFEAEQATQLIETITNMEGNS